ncbi:preQ(0) biosynthesis protein QueD [Natranaerovirga hydrolytica]|uniref:6-carboxy-5,6,7,8-tetrahydropterin synthase n=1 Tax=Natranaerovirga hydrolytica TaxID=680378 RepID=A0A4R1ML73_9FIRM|nr:6-carboxytetrahydropterin synthase QueD [Natranaerovirga hydrolytica]TCK92820.1 preQ(0) biosynthesis protein QueD [Natranaerovirga hydrolytica]
MYILRTESSFDSAHFLSNYEGKCKNIHGHRWRVEVEVQSEKLIERGVKKGMVVDFSDFKKDLKQLVDALDHKLIIEKETLKNRTLECLLEEGFEVIQVDFRPTAENFSAYFYNVLEEQGYTVKRATVYETPNNSATYER